MIDFLAAMGLLLAIEGLIFAISPAMAKEAMKSAAETPSDRMRIIGVVSAVAGVVLVFVARRIL